MHTNGRLFRIWCLINFGVFLFEALPGRNSFYTSVAAFDKNRWLHFLVYMAIVSIPFATWKNRADMVLSLIPPFLTYSLEYMQSSIYGPQIRYRNLSADLFGIAAGILLGFNLRVLRSSNRRQDDPPAA